MKKQVLIHVSYLDGDKQHRRTFYKHGSEEWIKESFDHLVEYYRDLQFQHNLKNLIFKSEEIVNTKPYELYY